MAIVYLSLGSNIGDRLGYVQQAASILGTTKDIHLSMKQNPGRWIHQTGL